MRIVASCAAIGACLGAVVAVLAHFLSHTLPTHYWVGFSEIGSAVSFAPPPLTHPSWWPSLRAAVAVGLLVGGCVGLAADRLGLRWTRAAGAAS